MANTVNGFIHIPSVPQPKIYNHEQAMSKPACTRENRLRASTNCFKADMKVWDDTADDACECAMNVPQTKNHIFSRAYPPFFPPTGVGSLAVPSKQLQK